MFLDFNGILYDYFDGETDLKNKVIRFVGEAEARIREDYLRIFRYFRFHARFGSAAKHDLETLTTIRDNLNGLEKISGERIWTEMKRILVIRNCFDVIDVMLNDIQIGKHMGFRPHSQPINFDERSETENYCKDLSEFKKILSNLTSGVDSGLIKGWEASTLFASLIEDPEELLGVVKRLKLSNVERDSILYIIKNRENFGNYRLSDFKKQLALTKKPEQNKMRQSIIDCMKYCGLFDQISTLSKWTIPDFPFTGLLVKGRVNNSKLIEIVLNELKMFWVNSEFKCTEDDLKLELEKVLTKQKYK